MAALFLDKVHLLYQVQDFIAIVFSWNKIDRLIIGNQHHHGCFWNKNGIG